METYGSLITANLNCKFSHKLENYVNYGQIFVIITMIKLNGIGPCSLPILVQRQAQTINEMFFRFRTSDVIILGDLNASAPYVSAADWKTNRLKNNPKCHWLIQGNFNLRLVPTHYLLLGFELMTS